MRLEAAHLSEQDVGAVQVAHRLRVNTKSAYQWRRCWRAGGEAALASKGAGGAVTACSLFPPTAPIFMPLRTALTSVPVWQVAAAVILMIASTFALMRVGGRVYRGAVLRMGQRLRLRQAWHGE